MSKLDLIATFQQKLLDAGFNIVEQSSINPIVNAWSVTVHDRDCPLLLAKGKGCSKKAALTNALRDFIGLLSTHSFWTDCYLGDETSNSKFVHYPNERWFATNANGSWPNGVLDGEQGEGLRDLYNPDGELNASNLIDINTSNRERGICCLPYVCIRTGKIINFPVNIVSNLYASNGISAAKGIDEARFQGLSKVIEQYIKFKVISEGLSLPIVPEDVLSRYPKIQASIKEAEDAGYELLVQDASLGGKYPVIAVILLNPHNQGVSVSFGASPSFNTALELSLTDLFLGRELDQFETYPEAGFDMDEISSPQNLDRHYIDSSGIVAWKSLKNKPDYEFSDWDKQDSSTDSATEFKALCDTVHTDGNDIFIADYNQIGVYTCRVLVPGLSEIYPVDDLVWENNNVGLEIRSQILKANKTLEECEQLIQDLEDLNQDDETLVSELIGIPSDADCIFSDLRITELITLLALKTQDNERIQEGCEWLLHFQQINPRRLKTYQCINTVLQLDGMTDYGSALEKLYTRPVFKDALALIDGEDVFPLISDWKMHGLLIDGYKKITKH